MLKEDNNNFKLESDVYSADKSCRYKNSWKFWVTSSMDLLQTLQVDSVKSIM